MNESLKNTLNEFLKFSLAEAIAGRRSRRFCVGAEIPDGVLSFRSKHDPLPLSEIEQLLLLSYMGGVTGWHFAIMRHERYAPNTRHECCGMRLRVLFRRSCTNSEFSKGMMFYLASERV